MFKAIRQRKSRLALRCLLDRAEVFFTCGNREALVDLQRLVLRPIQSIHMLDAYLRPDHHAIESLDMWVDLNFGVIPQIEQTLEDFVLDNREILTERLPIAQLGHDIVLPTCWNPTSMQRMLGAIGQGRILGEWRQDDVNHNLIWCYPLNIYWVTGGNHSIMQGVLLAGGELAPKEGYDLSGLYSYLQFDGDSWRDNHSGKALGKPRYQAFGYAFEIGRLIFALDGQ